MITTERFIARLPSLADLDHWQDLLTNIVAVANPLNQNSWRAMEKKGMKFIRNELYANKYEVVRYEIYK